LPPSAAPPSPSANRSGSSSLPDCLNSGSAPLGFRVPFNLESGESIQQRRRAWRRHDPINLLTRYRAALKSLRGIYIDCGWRDQYHSLEELSRLLDAVGLELIVREKGEAASLAQSVRHLAPREFDNASFIDGSKAKILSWGKVPR
jgi:hypothetical protein